MGLRPGWASGLAGWASGLAGWPKGGGRTDVRTYVRTDRRKISPFYRTSSPIGAAAQKAYLFSSLLPAPFLFHQIEPRTIFARMLKTAIFLTPRSVILSNSIPNFLLHFRRWFQRRSIRVLPPNPGSAESTSSGICSICRANPCSEKRYSKIGPTLTPTT